MTPRPFIPCLKHGRAALEVILSRDADLGAVTPGVLIHADGSIVGLVPLADEDGTSFTVLADRFMVNGEDVTHLLPVEADRHSRSGKTR